MARLKPALLLAAAAHALAGCPDGTWRENSATGKCYKLAPGYVAHGGCDAKCAEEASLASSEASLACIQSELDNEFVFEWLKTDGIPGTPRLALWIGNYRLDTDANGSWTGCTGASASSAYTNWTTMSDELTGCGNHGDQECQREPATNPMTGEPLQCALFEARSYAIPGGGWSDPGWFSRDCLYWYTCLCEAGSPTSDEYRSWHTRHYDAWMAPWSARGAWTFVIGALVGLFPGLACVQGRLCGSAKAVDWSTRVKRRVSFVMLLAGWFTLCVGFAPIVAFFVGFHAVYAIGYPQGYAALVPVGLSWWLLAVVPDNLGSTTRALGFGIFFYTLFALVGLAAIWFWGINVLWTAGLAMGVIFLVAGVGLAVVSALAICKIRDARRRHLRLWACVRLFFLMLAAISIGLFIEYIVNLNSQWSENVGWLVLAVTSLVCSAITRPPWRNAFCVWLSGSMRSKIGDKKDAVEAAKLIWIDLDSAAVSGGVEV